MTELAGGGEREGGGRGGGTNSRQVLTSKEVVHGGRGWGNFAKQMHFVLSSLD